LVARNTVQDARDIASRLKHEAEDYCDQKLAAFEIVLERTMKTVQAGREKLRVTPLPAAEEAPLAGAEDSGQHEAFFDQDESRDSIPVRCQRRRPASPARPSPRGRAAG